MHDTEPMFSNTQLLVMMAIAFLGGLVAPLLFSSMG